MYQKGFRDAALRVYDFVRSVRKTSKILNIAKSTFQRWKRNSTANKQSVLSKRQATIQAAVRKYITENPFTTCNQLRNIIKQSLGVNASRQFIAVVIKRNGFSKVKTRNVHLKHHEQLPRLKEFMKHLLECVQDDTMIVAIDECGVDSRTIPKLGYAPRGTRLNIADKRSCTWKRRNVIMSMSSNGQWNYEIHHKPVDTSAFRQYIENLPYPRDTVLILDNIAFHKSNSVTQAMTEKGYTPLYIPPYCPDANPIENLFGIIKNKFRVNWIDTLTNTEHSFDNILEDTICDSITRLKSFDAIFAHSLKWMHVTIAGCDGDTFQMSPSKPRTEFQMTAKVPLHAT